KYHLTVANCYRFDNLFQKWYILLRKTHLLRKLCTLTLSISGNSRREVMKKLCSLIVLFLICSSLLIPIQASANSGGEIDCSVTPDECEQMIAAQALVIQDLGGEPVPWPGQTPV